MQIKLEAEDDKIFDMDTLAEYLGIKKNDLYRKVALKEIPYFKAGNLIGSGRKILING